MPGAGSLWLPIEIRSVEKYQKALIEAGFQYEEEAVHATRQVLNEKRGLRGAAREPVALVYKCVKGQPM